MLWQMKLANVMADKISKWLWLTDVGSFIYENSHYENIDRQIGKQNKKSCLSAGLFKRFRKLRNLV